MVTIREKQSRSLIALALVAIATVTPQHATAGPIEWSDGFKTYSAGRFPGANWTNSGNTQVSVTDSTRESGAKSLFLYGLIGQNWAALAHRKFTPAASHRFGFSVKNGAERLSGVHQEYGAFNLNTGPTWTTPGRSLILFGQDGNIHAGQTGVGELSGPILGQFTAGTWYDVQVEYIIESLRTVSLSYWINGSFDGTYKYAALANESSLSYAGLVSGAGSAWFDNVSVASVSSVPEPGTLALAVLCITGILVQRRVPTAKALTSPRCS